MFQRGSIVCPYSNEDWEWCFFHCYHRRSCLRLQCQLYQSTENHCNQEILKPLSIQQNPWVQTVSNPFVCSFPLLFQNSNMPFPNKNIFHLLIDILGPDILNHRMCNCWKSDWGHPRSIKRRSKLFWCPEGFCNFVQARVLREWKCLSNSQQFHPTKEWLNDLVKHLLSLVNKMFPNIESLC